MSKIKKNIIANFLGTAWNSIIGFIFIPIYIKFLGIESYGLIGVFLAFQGILYLLDFGLSGTVNREIALYKDQEDKKQLISNLIYSVERVYLYLFIGLVFVLSLISYFFANQWVNSNSIDSTVIQKAFIIMSLNFGLIFFNNLYVSCLNGFQKQVKINTITIIMSTLKSLGSIAILYFISNSVLAFLLWQLIVTLIQTILLKLSVNIEVNSQEYKPSLDYNLLIENSNFSMGLFTISLLILILTQSDKIILSKIVSLSDFGYYTMAYTIASMINMLVVPITGAVYPKLVNLHSKNAEVDFNQVFHKTSQLISFLVMPISIALFVFADDLIMLWTHDPVITQHTFTIFRFLLIGFTFNALMNLPYQCTLVYGWVQYGIRVTLTAILFFLPVIYYSAFTYGILGSSISWAVLNILYFIFAIIYLFSHIMKSQAQKWYLDDIFKPLLICIILSYGFYFFKIHNNTFLNVAFFILLVLLQQAILFQFILPQLKRNFSIKQLF